METLIFDHGTGNAAEIICAGGLVAVPTETVYGLAGNGMDEKAVEKIYEVKGRPAIKPLSLMVASPEEIGRYAVDVPEAAKALAEKFWPGPLTIVLKANPDIPEIVRAGGDTIGLRCPDHALTLQALREAGVPFAAPSANLSGAPSPKTAGDVLKVFDGVIDAVIDGGACTLGRESTILDMSKKPYRVLRQGALPEESILDALVENMHIFGITGTTGSGKTSVLEAFRKKGALLLDCDRLYHDLLETSEGMLRELEDRFPDAFEKGRLVRKKLASIVFHNEAPLADLNAITHRYVCEDVKRQLRAHAMSGGQIAVIDAVELISSGLGALCDCTIAVLAPEAERMKRIMARDGLTEEQALERIRAQKNDAYYRENCTYTVLNDGTFEQLSEKINQIMKEVL
ncbi:MAG: threonylcarbamoyl-AMP synthase [Oscillospiraceae bacterium]|nr:threonylcarbamoyl-AMP synthase [Oscillospiraceae bacterium]